ncbi:LysR family transcriptional regulator [Variovorax saccharolyticus]|uniref:LysR family transcriptional regulator n=1 Tax=Variovorax saccharolyticus TaxID=3053516 RepID=UPI002574F768|nr:LysR family transcriptional regulator [Variovorax sp. J22R187]MDM0017437.1 LysR substrate-binding domain-containing protein [Variovorax sp. J22R187]
MQPLSHLESFVRSAEALSFSAAARQLGLTPAAVSKNVARLEAALGVRLFQRSTRKLTLTEGGERLFREIGGALGTLADAVAGLAQDGGAPAGILKVSMGLAFGRAYVLPHLAEFLARYPAVQPDWHFDNRQVDLIGEGFDAGIGGGIELTQGLVARELARIHIVATAAPSFLAGKRQPRHPADLAGLDGIVRRSSPTGRVRSWTLRNRAGEEGAVETRPRLVFSDPEAMRDAAVMGLGVALLPMAFALPALESGALVRLLPGWYADNGPISLHYPSKKLLPAKTRVFVDFLVERLREQDFARRMLGN